MFSDVEIGFEQTMYAVAEDVASGFAVIRVLIRRGELRIPVSVTVTLSDGTAIGKVEFGGRECVCWNVAALIVLLL